MRRSGLELLVAPNLAETAERLWRSAQLDELVWSVDPRLPQDAWDSAPAL
jgi:hypothetical protein